MGAPSVSIRRAPCRFISEAEISRSYLAHLEKDAYYARPNKHLALSCGAWRRTGRALTPLTVP